MWTNQIIIFSGLFFAFIVFLLVGISIAKSYKRAKFVMAFTDYRGVLEYHMEKAYDMVHKENILPYSLEAFRVDDDDYDRISSEFVKLVQKFIGPMLLEEFIYLYGDEDTFIFNVLEYFSGKYESDEIRNATMEQITETKDDTLIT